MDPLAQCSSRRSHLVHAPVPPRAHGGPARGVAGDRPGRRCPDRRAHRLRQDPRRVPLRHRPAAPERRPRTERSPTRRPWSTCRRSARSPRDIQQNLETPLAEIREVARELELHVPEVRVRVRTGDTPASARATMVRRPPHIVVTTPESLYLLVTAGKSRETLRRVETVIVDEIHATAQDKRGAHLALTLERLAALDGAAATADWPLRDAAPDRDGGATPGRGRGRDGRLPGRSGRRAGATAGDGAAAGRDGEGGQAPGAPARWSTSGTGAPSTSPSSSRRASSRP